MTPTIRTLGPADLEGLLALHTQLNPMHPALAPDAARKRFDALLQRPGFMVFGAYAGDRLVGSCVLHILPDLTRNAASYALIDNVLIASGERRKGFRQHLVRAARAAAAASGYGKVMLMSRRPQRAPALRQLKAMQPAVTPL